MKALAWILVVVVMLAVFVTVLSGMYTVPMDQQVIITQFQAPVGKAIKEPGLHWKIPYIQKANYFDKRWLEWDGDPNQIPTRDKKYIYIDTYARWRIADPLLFFQRVRNEQGAQSRLDDVLDGETRIAIAKYELIEIVRSSNREFAVPEEMSDFEDLVTAKPIKHGRAKIMKEILEKAQVTVGEYGIEVVDIRVKRINYVEKVREKVYERMISERKRIAEKYRSEGKGESEKILGDMEKELKRIRSEAERTAAEKIGAADGEATRIYAEAYSVDPEFYAFIKTMETYKNTVDKDSWLVFTTKGEFYKYMTGIEK